jgi:hypothetical protein
MLPALIKKQVAKRQGVLQRALKRMGPLQEERGAPVASLGFLIDATGSRAATWEKAQTIQARMFRTVADIGRLSVQLVYFGGLSVKDCGPADDPRKLAVAMARVRCASGLTQFVPGLLAFVDNPYADKVSAIILIGDAFEEDPREIERIAGSLKRLGIRIYSFLEGDDTTAEDVFREIAEITGGRFAKFGDDLPLGDLCEGVALLASGGERALQRLPNERVRQLLLTGPAR